MTRDRWVELRKSKNLTQEQLAIKLGIQRSTYSNYEGGKREPDFDTAKLVADFFEVSVDYLMGNKESVIWHTPGSGKTESNQSSLSDKEEKSIAAELERIMAGLESDESLAFSGEPEDEEERELLRASLENSLRIAKMIAKKKFTPKKYRK